MCVHHLFVYLCVCVWVCVCVNPSVGVCMCVCVRACVCVLCVCTLVCIHVCVSLVCVLLVSVCVCMFVCVLCVCTLVCINVCVSLVCGKVINKDPRHLEDCWESDHYSKFAVKTDFGFLYGTSYYYIDIIYSTVIHDNAMLIFATFYIFQVWLLYTKWNVLYVMCP